MPWYLLLTQLGIRIDIENQLFLAFGFGNVCVCLRVEDTISGLLFKDESWFFCVFYITDQ